MIEMKEAVTRAFEEAKKVFSQEKLIGLDLEEIEHHDSKNEWLITLGFWDRDTDPSKSKKYTGILSNEKLMEMIGVTGPNDNDKDAEKYVRKYKRFVINSETGKFKAMHRREV